MGPSIDLADSCTDIYILSLSLSLPPSLPLSLSLSLSFSLSLPPLPSLFQYFWHPQPLVLVILCPTLRLWW